MSTLNKYNYIAVEGNIGAGKTTLSKMLAEKYNTRLILEEFTDNPFLPQFYKKPKRYAFPVELFFLAERHKQLQQELKQGDVFKDGVISDYIFQKTLLFAKKNLDTEEFRLFRRLFSVLDDSFGSPDLIIYLHRPIDVLRFNIIKRGRSYEQNLKDEYLILLQKSYFEYFKTITDVPILILDMGNKDFVRDKTIFKAIRKLLAKSYKPGVQQIKL